jgi:hypothetical protein
VYVAALDMPRFINDYWPRVPLDKRVVLITAQEVGRWGGWTGGQVAGGWVGWVSLRACVVAFVVACEPACV